MLKLTNKIELIIPREDNNGNVIKSKKISEAVDLITRINGGCTITEVTGQWYSEDHKMIMEDNNLNLEWFIKDGLEFLDTQSLLDNLSLVIRTLITEYGQEAISFKHNGNLYLIFPEDLDMLSYDLHEIIFK